ncbi:FAD-binding oxidoreductase [Beggiatoa leptomitoformis]|uniref:Delta(24)-sterol reductase n=1 Tax=Beggiatoa leptomitoformis TaxID=288004 RepID=A0A2N9Y9V9_9GAMM|nr:FAD-binding oxidoreductase [Beggiatoa leptomitoformis]ALG67318.1 FAD-binding protein [Beggiatoa leptomitoformis]AUI67247.1 FAD-binding protein [Beggiatoa leptomitoformis]
MATTYQSWGRYPLVEQTVYPVQWANDAIPISARKPVLAYGKGRSYGDVCLNDKGILLDTRYLNHFIQFDRTTGILLCESGVSLQEILQLIVPMGWFLPVTPGTQFVTLGGAIANDVHGKNHHVAGTFGCHVRQFELLRSDGQRLLCSANNNADWFGATIGGLGLTGLITWAEIQLIPMNNPFIQMESIKFHSIEEFLTLSKASEKNYTYTVAWLDCLQKQSSRGLFMQGNHAPPLFEDKPLKKRAKWLTVPVDMPNFMLNHASIKAFNFLYFNKQLPEITRSVSHYLPFFYPLDSIQQWNRIYGKRGFFQYQCVVSENDPHVIKNILAEIAKSGQGSFLSVIKIFGKIPSPGLLSFPRAGITLALDFANQGEVTHQLLTRLDAIVREDGGRLYPAKDARMNGTDFKQFYPEWEKFQPFIDPHFSSSFWRRVTQRHPKNG